MEEIDYRQFNVRDDAGQQLCPACGLSGYFSGRSYDRNSGLIGTGICPCCFFEPGFDDDPRASADATETVPAAILAYRAQWISDGMPWRGEGGTPRLPDWNPKTQLDHLRAVASDLLRGDAS